MSDALSPIRLPLGFPSKHAAVVAAPPQNDEQFTASEIEFIRHLFGRSQFLRAHARATPLSDSFLAAIVTLIDVLVENEPTEAEHCAAQLRKILDAVLPSAGGPGSFPVTPT
ncbi:hypothetical protein [Burkholderia ubonensis]|uniref:hypothetical protein n=1 Tax=Burkholderia ubonensis TaxID=101571 RepID=UPI000AA006D6|nr:hypothetical protein [Burkholderia ubonensis]